ncbi:MAG TPA: ribonuclease BN, partial [Caulobacteraceae bacterium]
MTDTTADHEEPLTPGQEAYAVERQEPGRGRTATWPQHIPAKGWRDIFWRIVFSFFGDRLPSVAGGVAYFLLLSIFPSVAAFVSLYGLFADVAMVSEQLQSLAGVL